VGLLAAITAFTIWGFFPFYFKATDAAGAVEILAHRIVWSVPFGLCLIILRRQWKELWDGLCNTRLLGWLFFSSAVIAINWGVYIWAVQIDQIYQASLGYYMNPLVLVVSGLLFFGERLTRLKTFAVLLAAAGVITLAIYDSSIHCPHAAFLLRALFWRNIHRRSCHMLCLYLDSRCAFFI